MAHSKYMSIVAYQELALPLAPDCDPAAVVPLFERVLRLEVPGFVVAHAGTMYDEMLGNIQPAAREAGIIIDTSRSAVFVSDGSTEEGDIGLHIDGMPNPHTPPTLNFHHTFQGSAAVRLATTGPEFTNMCRMYPDPKSNFIPLPTGTTELFAEGRVDTRVLNRDVHATTIAAGSLLVFMLHGAHPTVHQFASTETPRVSEAGFGILRT